MGNVILIKYPATRKYVVLARRESKLDTLAYKDDDYDAILESLHDDLFTKILEEDEQGFLELNRKETRVLNGEVIFLSDYRGMRTRG